MGSRDETFSGFSSTHFIRFSLNYWSLSRFILTYHLLQTKRQQNGRTPGRTHFRIISSGLLNLGGLDAQLDQFAHPYCPQSPYLWLWTLQRWILSQKCRRDQPLPGRPQWRHVLHHVYFWS